LHIIFKLSISMLIAQEKFKTNIVEYILYMFHIEDVIRAHKFDLTELDKNIIAQYKLPADKLSEVSVWYQGLIKQMDKDGILESGHLSSLNELISKLNDLHIQLINTLDEERYIELYHWASEYIKELKQKMSNPGMTEVEVCLNGLYTFMLMKMKGLHITEETSQAMATFSQMLRYLSKKYRELYH
jgi:flagellin-specific chaperone FliS